MSVNTYGINQPSFTVSTASTTANTNPFLYSNGTSVSWATVSASPDLRGTSLEVHGDANFTKDVDIIGDLKVQGKSLKESLVKIEERLAILHPNEELEEKWENLRGLRKMYMELEAEIIEKEKMWAILRK